MALAAWTGMGFFFFRFRSSRNAFRRGLLAGIFLLGTLSLSSCGQDSENGGDQSSAPYPGVPQGAAEVSGEKNFAQLLRSASRGKVTRTPWAGYWWPYLEDGISEAADRYERARGRSGTVSWEIRNHGSNLPGVASWWGHCNGWAAAAVLFEEPREPKKVDSVTFSVADQKALLSEAAMEVTADYFGTRAESSNPNDPAFQDVFPNQFFLVLTNYVGRGFPVIMDRYTGNQVWNHPIVGYQIDQVKPSDDLGSESRGSSRIHRVMLTLRTWWARDDVPVGHLSESFQFADSASFESRTLRMEIWLDAPLVFEGGQLKSSGNVILTRSGNFVGGGVWRNGNLEASNSHPDYLWVPHGLKRSTGFSNPGIDPVWLKNFQN